MADQTVENAEGGIKKRNPPKKKQKNNVPKNYQRTWNGQRNRSQNSDAVKNPPPGFENVATGVNEGSNHATPERVTNVTNNHQRAQKQFWKNNRPPKRPNDARVQNNGPGRQPQDVGPRSNSSASTLVENSLDRLLQEELEHQQDLIAERKYQQDLHRKKIEDERNKKWYHHFLARPNDLITMDRHTITVLKNMVIKRPHAQFYCLVCHYYCDNMSVVGAHIRHSAHEQKLQDYREETTIRELPPPTREQLAVLNSLLLRVVDEHCMNPSHQETRRTIAVLVDELVTTNLKGCSTRMFGSSIHGLGLKTADVNIDLQVPEGSSPPAMLKAVVLHLSKSPHFGHVMEHFDCEFPFVSFTYNKSGEQCSISLNNERAVNLACLLSKYTPLDPRVTQLSTLFRYWGQITMTDRAQEGTLPGSAFYLMTIFYLQKCKNPVLPVLNDFLPEPATSSKVLGMNVADAMEKWRTNNRENLASLWVGLLKFYALEFEYSEFSISIDSTPFVPRISKKMMFIVDPFLSTRNVARSITSVTMFYYILDCLMTTCRYFLTPQLKQGSLFGTIYTRSDKYHPDHEALLSAHDRINSHLVLLITKLDNNFKKPRTDVAESIAEVFQLMVECDFSKEIDKIPFDYLKVTCVPPKQAYENMSVSASDARLLASLIMPRALEYVFTAAKCTGKRLLPRVCDVCKEEGHLKDQCPEEKLPILVPLPPLTPLVVNILDSICIHIYEKWKQSDEDTLVRLKICKELEKFIRAAHPTARLELFGSTKNGLGLKGSDMDICMTFHDNKTGEGLDTRGFIEELFKHLKTFKGVYNLLAIPTAKVPIVKFTHKQTHLEGDISLYNVLGIENSKLLHTYVRIDNRTRILGLMMKRFSKICNIGDASKGSLSSYAYSLIVIFFLQRCDPPVLPVLQELTESNDPPPKHMVDGCDTYYFKNLSVLERVWPGKGRNTQSVGQLWLSLLIFYTEQFDLLNNVVSIRCSRILPKFEKLWISKGIAIEDPFDRNHNLGSALTRKMSLYIIKALRKGRNHFGCSMKPNSTGKDLESYYMDIRDLTDGEPPNDRGCRICKSIGHKEKTCPEKKKRTPRQHNDHQGKNVKKEAIAKQPIKV